MYRAILKVLCILIVFQVTHQAKKPKTAVLTELEDIKEFRKILRTKTNVLVLYVDNARSSRQVVDVFRDTADGMKGQATLIMFECNTSHGKKFCKKLKGVPEKDKYIMKHYKDGHYNRDYDRDITVNAMSNFLRDPTGELPWEEDPNARDIHHFATPEVLLKFFKSGLGAHKRTLVMFYAPWCTYCKIMKPDYVQAAADLKGEALLAAIDVAKPGNSHIREHFNITGFPTLLYFEKGQPKFQYNGDNKKQAIVDFMRDPQPQPKKKPEVKEESWSQDSDVVHLNSENFDSVLTKAEKALVVFYAPWCGHCKKIKPELEKAAARMIKEKIDGVIAAVDATKEGKIATKFAVKGYPTMKYFSRGVFKFEADVRQEDDIITFMKNPQAPAPPPPPEKPWTEEESLVRHLGLPSFKNTLRKVKHAIVMFYAPWCGHCKMTKPEFVKAAETFADELMVAFGAVDCTTEQELCSNYDVKGYPTIKYFSYYDKQVKDYTGGRKADDFVSYINSFIGSPSYSTKPTPTAQAAGYGTNVVVVSDANFESTIASPTLTLVMFYATWCDHCTASKPAYSKVATAMKSSGEAAVIAIDAAENPKTADFAKIETLPTYKIFQSGREVAVYTGDRSDKSLIEFIQKHKVKDEL